MPISRSCVFALLLIAAAVPVQAAKLTVDLGRSYGVRMIGAFHRWDIDGNPTKPVNPKAKIESPEVDAVAVDQGDGKWVFEDLKPGRYDLVIMGTGRGRIEGWHYPPVLEFDPFFPPTATTETDVREFITDDIGKARHYENKVVPLYMGGDKKAVRVLVMLIRDKTTSYEGHMPGAATIRHEVWQYDWQYGGWAKNKRTRVFDRSILPRDELRRWTWLWDARLGGIEMKDAPVTIEYKLSKPTDADRPKGLLPY